MRMFMQYFKTEVIDNKQCRFNVHTTSDGQLLKDDFIYAITGCKKTKTTFYYSCYLGINCITSINEETIRMG